MGTAWHAGHRLEGPDRRAARRRVQGLPQPRNPLAGTQRQQARREPHLWMEPPRPRQRVTNIERWIAMNPTRLFRLVSGNRRAPCSLKPILWFCPSVSSICFGSAIALAHERGLQRLAAVVALVGILPILVACFTFLWFTLRRPEKLHSEQYELRDKALDLLDHKGSKVELTPASLTDLVGLTTEVPKSNPPTSLRTSASSSLQSRRGRRTRPSQRKLPPEFTRGLHRGTAL